MSGKRPLIGIALDSQETGCFADFPYFAVRRHYFQAVYEAGGDALGFPHDRERLDFILETFDGFVFPGGDDIDPDFFGEELHPTVKKVHTERSAFEIDLIKKAVELDKPVLGVCMGMQHLAVARGGGIIQDIVDQTSTDHNHWQKPATTSKHDLKVEEGTLLHQIIGANVAEINSVHHQAVRDDGDYIVSGRAHDGIVEAIEVPGKKFCMGVQWHPEFYVDPDFGINQIDRKLFEAFVKAAAA